MTGFTESDRAKLNGIALHQAVLETKVDDLTGVVKGTGSHNIGLVGRMDNVEARHDKMIGAGGLAGLFLGALGTTLVTWIHGAFASGGK